MFVFRAVTKCLDAEKGVIRLVIFVHVTITYNIRKDGHRIGGGGVGVVVEASKNMRIVTKITNFIYHNCQVFILPENKQIIYNSL